MAFVFIITAKILSNTLVLLFLCFCFAMSLVLGPQAQDRVHAKHTLDHLGLWFISTCLPRASCAVRWGFSKVMGSCGNIVECDISSGTWSAGKPGMVSLPPGTPLFSLSPGSHATSSFALPALPIMPSYLRAGQPWTKCLS